MTPLLHPRTPTGTPTPPTSETKTPLVTAPFTNATHDTFLLMLVLVRQLEVVISRFISVTLGVFISPCCLAGDWCSQFIRPLYTLGSGQPMRAMDLSHVTRLVVTSLLISAVIGSLPYGARPACYNPPTVIITVAQEVTREVAVPTRVFKNELIPTRRDLDRINRVTENVLVELYAPQLVTTTVQQGVIQLNTVYDYTTTTIQHPVIATVDNNVPVDVTITDRVKEVSYHISTGVVEVTEIAVVPQTTVDIVYSQITNIEVVPVISTVWDHKVVESTLCPHNYYY
ncbi:uncharacterized protein LOC123505915 [Portunus trituberculatus]|uniref:uncharacterized protein LOC123505915 n=1 Tax=Portunus trituberculatus TaxID=210409 RepID=UPI001E1D1E8C|nr:uncharacterized protein LOC123505915 [Portunus trituberculatus]